KEWGLNNTYIFVRSRREYKEIEQSFDEKCFFFGNEKQSVYNFNAIVNDKFNKMAAMRNEVYDIEYEVTHNEDKVNYTEEDFLNIKKQSSVSWYLHKTQTDRLSSIYCCLSLRCKLHMLGLDYCSSDSAEKGLTESEYFNIYAKDDMPNTSFYNVTIDGKAIVKYTTDYKQSKRKNLAMCEHYRWNSFMISQGFVPASINSILSEKIVNKKGVEKYSNGKNISIRTHGNLTTFEGLKQFSKLIAQRDGKSEAEKDVIKYDYQLLDDAYWFITKTGNKIIYKKSYGSK
ncbi:MAG: hypothetical protein IJW13_00370, partial [Clostridia bacterium]|nr:hypothetical protein [Clostridia bacterium]